MKGSNTIPINIKVTESMDAECRDDFESRLAEVGLCLIEFLQETSIRTELIEEGGDIRCDVIVTESHLIKYTSTPEAHIHAVVFGPDQLGLHTVDSLVMSLEATARGDTA